MTKNAVAGTYTPYSWSDGTTRSWPEPEAPLIPDASKFTYLGGFALPSTFNYGGMALGFGPMQGSPPSGSTGKTLYASNNTASGTAKTLGAIYIPDDSNLSDDCSYVAQTYIAPATDAANAIQNYIETNSTQTAANGARLSGCYYDEANNRLVVGYYWYYPNSYSDSAPLATFNCATIDPSLDISSINIDQQIGTSTHDSRALDASQYAAAWGPVASEWQSELGGDTLASIGMLAILGNRCGYGPTLSAFSPGNLATGVPLATSLLAMYGNPGTTNASEAISGFDPTQGWGYGDTGGASAFAALKSSNTWSLSGAQSVACVFAPPGWRNTVIVGTNCAGVYVYGEATSTEAQAGQVQTTAIFTATATIGSNVLTNVVVSSGTIAVGNPVCTLDGDGFFAVFPGFKPATPSDVASAVKTTVTAYDSGAGTLTLSNASPTVAGSYTFCANTGEVYAYDPTGVGGKGTWAYPYVFQAWCFDNDELVEFKNGTRAAQDVVPTVIALPWPPNIATGQAARRMQGHGCVELSPSSGAAARIYMQITTSGTVQIGVWELAAAS